ncbi:hypothetical protein BDQ17DRAFT_67227 [Cyathus striatus]|nr:hypothetical protein BDQ17DRAFT_67227 [Cyathus striatus]
MTRTIMALLYILRHSHVFSHPPNVLYIDRDRSRLPAPKFLASGHLLCYRFGWVEEEIDSDDGLLESGCSFGQDTTPTQDPTVMLEPRCLPPRECECVNRIHTPCGAFLYYPLFTCRFVSASAPAPPSIRPLEATTT